MNTHSSIVDGTDRTGTLRFGVLGPVRAWRGDTALDLGSPQQRAVLAVLVLRHGDVVGSTEIITALWGDRPPARALGAVRTYVSRLRTILDPHRSAGSELLRSTPGGYSLRIAPEAIDLVQFEAKLAEAERARLRGELAAASALIGAALELCHGSPLADIAGPFAQAKQMTLTQRQRTAFEQRIELDLQLGRHAEVTADLSLQIAEWPWCERLRELLILALYRGERQAEALAVYTEIQRLLADELGTTPGPALRELHRRILMADPALAAPRPADSSGPATLSATASRLPPDLDDFTGRVDQIGSLSSALTDGDGTAVAIAAITGLGGIGKTTLAVRVAHEVRDRFPDGQFSVDLRGNLAEPADPGTVLAGLLGALGTAQTVIPESLDERAALYRSVLAGRRVLVVLDNASGPAQVRPLFPGSPSSAVLITSRSAMVGLPATRFVDLDGLAPAEALALLAKIIGPDRVEAEPDAALAMVASCGWLPLAIRIIASRLNENPQWTVQSVVDRLADERLRLGELRTGNLAVEASFELSYRQLDPPSALAFRLLALPEVPDISLTAAAAVLNLDEAAAESLLEPLVDARLLSSTAPGRYRYHDLIRLFARQHAAHTDSHTERVAAVNRLLDHYLSVAFDDLRASPHRDSTGPQIHLTRSPVDVAWAWLVAEYPAVLGIIGQVATTRNGDLATAAILLRRCANLLNIGVGLREIQQTCHVVVTSARQRGQEYAEVLGQFVLGITLLTQGRTAEAEAELRAALERWPATGAERPLPSLLHILAATLQLRGNQLEATQLAERAVRLAAEVDTPLVGARASMVLAQARMELGQLDGTVELAERATQVYQELGDTGGHTYLTWGLALVLAGAGRPADAIASHHEGLRLAKLAELPMWACHNLVRLVDLYLPAGQTTAALRCAEEALSTAEAVGNRFCVAESKARLGNVLTELGQRDRATACWLDAYREFTALDNPGAELVRARLTEIGALP